ncbi:protein TRANSPARENT TESTA 9 isoform X1 [Macadamia integrifolia]|uniref:protein TRANSPARENT TESTA 9 isoform X1 n=1 Tax=Macadamia integrifolia TaxID=60698 RepID=UPI001C4F864C|nr:protein TRANSPARENT TESTA 9 isoform X1 [Macadamia integrifolia]
MWFSFWRSRNRFSLEELRYLTDQLEKIQIVNESNKDFVIEALRSIAELVTYGDQNDPAFFEFFMEKQVMGQFVRILNVSRTSSVPLQLLQTMSIMIQNLKSDHSIYYIFSNEHINSLITYSFDFRNEELLSYYVSFLRAISGKLNRSTISLLVKTQHDEVISFPLYIEAIRFAFHEETMVRIAVRALTLNVYHVGDEAVNKYVNSPPLADYFSNLVSYFREQCIGLDRWVSEASKYELGNPGPESTACILGAVDEIEDYLYYFSDVISAGIPDLGRLITENISQILIFPLLFSSLNMQRTNETQISVTTSLYLLCGILRIVKTKDLANSIAASLFCPLGAFSPICEAKPNGCMSGHVCAHENQQLDNDASHSEADTQRLRVVVANSSSSQIHPGEDFILQHSCDSPQLTLRESLLSHVVSGDDIQVLGSLSVLATLLQTKELDESMLDALGILPQRKQHKKLLLQALVGEGSGEEQLFSSETSSLKDGVCSEVDSHLQKLKDQYGLLCSCSEIGASPRGNRFQVLDALVSLFCRSNSSAETLWCGGWLLRQLLPYSEAEFNSHHLKLLKDTYKNCINGLLQEVRGTWPDLLITVLIDEWKKCKKAIEASSPQKEPRHILLPSQKCDIEGESSFTAGERMCEMVKVFVLLHQLQVFSLGRALPDHPPILSPTDVPTNSRAKTAGLDVLGPKPGTEIKLVDAVPCRIAFERGKERHFCFLATSRGTLGWVLLAEELPLKQNFGIIRVAAPLAGSMPRIDDKHPKWLHLRIRPSTLAFMDPPKSEALGKAKTKALIDGRWILAFRDEEACKSALSMILEEMDLQSNEVERRLKPLLNLDRPLDVP